MAFCATIGSESAQAAAIPALLEHFAKLLDDG